MPHPITSVCVPPGFKTNPRACVFPSAFRGKNQHTESALAGSKFNACERKRTRACLLSRKLPDDELLHEGYSVSEVKCDSEGRSSLPLDALTFDPWDSSRVLPDTTAGLVSVYI